MSKFLKFIRATIAGGMLFLIPVVAIIFILAKAFSILRNISKPIAATLPFTNVAGIADDTIITIILLLLICFLAGIFMRTRLANQIVKWLQDRVLVYIPGYSYIQALSTDWFSKERTANWKPASIFIDDNEVICFVVDETEDYYSIFLPSAPSPSSGSICVRKKKDVTLLPITISDTVKMIRQLGKGSSQPIQQIKPVHETSG